MPQRGEEKFKRWDQGCLLPPAGMSREMRRVSPHPGACHFHGPP